jgi:ribosome-binding protein aMBF1 (putative translation factor)
MMRVKRYSRTAPDALPDSSASPIDGGGELAASVLVLSFGIGVRQLREAQGWSQERLAENSNLNRSYIGEIERGGAIASLLTVEKLAFALKLTPSALVTRGEAISQMNLVRGIKLMAIAC